MSSIAQKLCNEIYDETSIKQSKRSILRDSKKSVTTSRSRYNGQPTTSIVIEKRREINKLVPKDKTSKSRTVIQKFKSRETLLDKKFVDAGLNTVITGPLKCDNDCITMVRRRDNKVCSCSCTKADKRISFLTSGKEVQTVDLKYYPVLDKACAQQIETVNCGTQLLEWSNHGEIKNDGGNMPSTIDVQIKSAISRRDMNNLSQDKSYNSSFARNFNVKGIRRWALSRNGPARGPDF
jgi:hypothetical protein